MCCLTNGADKIGKKDISNFIIKDFTSPVISQFLSGSRYNRSSVESRFILFSRKLLRRSILPDHTWLLKKSAKEKIRLILEEEKPDCVISISFPFVFHKIIRELRNNYPSFIWVADNRDMWSGNPYRGINITPRYVERTIERKCLTSADLVTFAAKTTRDIYALRYELKDALCIYNGFEEDESDCRFSSTPVDAKRQYFNFTSKIVKLVHTGSLYSGKRNIKPLINALDKIATETKYAFLVDLYGEGEASAEVYRELVVNYDHVFIHAHGTVPRSKAYQAQSEADFLVLAMSRGDFDKTYVPGKIFEYARARKPIIALCDEASEVSKIINNYDLGIATFNHDRISEFICNILENPNISLVPNNTRVNELSAKYQFGLLVNRVESIMASKYLKSKWLM